MALDGEGLTVIEQPLPADDLIGHASLAAMLRTPIGLDESITSLGPPARRCTSAPAGR